MFPYLDFALSVYLGLLTSGAFFYVAIEVALRVKGWVYGRGR